MSVTWRILQCLVSMNELSGMMLHRRNMTRGRACGQSQTIYLAPAGGQRMSADGQSSGASRFPG
ncbi:hypothetical protein CUC50_24780 [Citrobacter werkmanii]|nr:hypothetical protein CUC50_24780 [Citrobacter werkmanii]